MSSNPKFFAKFGEARTAFLVFYGRDIASRMGTATLREYVIRPIKVANTSSLPEGHAEAWATDGKAPEGPFFPHVDEVDLTIEAGQARITAYAKSAIDWREKEIAERKEQIAHFAKFTKEAV